MKICLRNMRNNAKGFDCSRTTLAFAPLRIFSEPFLS
jgi:hypothetical protein